MSGGGEEEAQMLPDIHEQAEKIVLLLRQLDLDVWHDACMSTTPSSLSPRAPLVFHHVHKCTQTLPFSDIV